MVIYAIGTHANPIIGQTSGLQARDGGYIAADADGRTSLSGVFAGGDIVTGSATVIGAMGAGRRAARAMEEYLGILEPRERDISDPEQPRVFGIDARQRNFVRLRAA